MAERDFSLDFLPLLMFYTLHKFCLLLFLWICFTLQKHFNAKYFVLTLSIDIVSTLLNKDKMGYSFVFSVIDKIYVFHILQLRDMNTTLVSLLILLCMVLISGVFMIVCGYSFNMYWKSSQYCPSFRRKYTACPLFYENIDHLVSVWIFNENSLKYVED